MHLGQWCSEKEIFYYLNFKCPAAGVPWSTSYWGKVSVRQEKEANHAEFIRNLKSCPIPINEKNRKRALAWILLSLRDRGRGGVSAVPLNRRWRFLGLYHGAFISRWKTVEEEEGGGNLWTRGSCSGHELSDALISFMTAVLTRNLKWQLIFSVMAQLQDTFNYAKTCFFQLLTSVHS